MQTTLECIAHAKRVSRLIVEHKGNGDHAKARYCTWYRKRWMQEARRALG